MSELLLVINNWGECAGYGTGELGTGIPESISDCYNDVCTGLSGEDWQRCMDACIEAVCESNPEECE